MKVGTVVYFAGMGSVPEGFDFETEIAGKGLPAGMTEITGSGPGEPGINFAELKLRRRGAHRVEYVKAFLDPEGSFQLSRA